MRTMLAIVLATVASLTVAATAALGSSRGVLHSMSVAQRPIAAELKLISKCKAPTCFARHGRYLERDARQARAGVLVALRGRESACARAAAADYLDAARAYRLAGHAFRFRQYAPGGRQITIGNRSLVAAAKRARRCI